MQNGRRGKEVRSAELEKGNLRWLFRLEAWVRRNGYGVKMELRGLGKFFSKGERRKADTKADIKAPGYRPRAGRNGGGFCV
jgi:hypothetical protein